MSDVHLINNSTYKEILCSFLFPPEVQPKLPHVVSFLVLYEYFNLNNLKSVHNVSFFIILLSNHLFLYIVDLGTILNGFRMCMTTTFLLHFLIFFNPCFRN